MAMSRRARLGDQREVHCPDSRAGADIEHFLRVRGDGREEELAVEKKGQHVVAARGQLDETWEGCGRGVGLTRCRAVHSAFHRSDPLKACIRRRSWSERLRRTHQYSVVWKFWNVRPCSSRYSRILAVTDVVELALGIAVSEPFREDGCGGLTAHRRM